jgi:diguanylate cyclase (GGDEF)-like protein/PAS domain S-box-containing protein
MRRLIYFILFFLYSSLHADTPILIMHSYHKTYPWTANQDKGFRSVINAQKELFPRFSTEYIATKRREFDKNYEQEFLQYLSAKYSGYSPKLIYVTDDDALSFMLHHKEKLFPSSPLVFSGINDTSNKNMLSNKNYAGVFDKKDISSNIKLIKTLFPQEKEVMLLSDDSTTSDIIDADARKEAQRSGLKIHSIHGSNYQSTLQQLQGFKGKIVLLTTVGGFKTKDGHPIPLKQAINEIKDVGNFILIALEDTYVQQGVIGGFVNVGRTEGAEAGKIALKVLKDPAKSPQSVVSKHEFLFDVKALNKLHIILPEEIAKKSQLINQQATFAHRYEDVFMDAVYLLLTLIVFGSLFVARYMYRSRKIILAREDSLGDMTESLHKAQYIAHFGHWDWDIQNNTLWWSDEIYRIFGLEPQEFEATYDAFLGYIHPDDKDKFEEAIRESLKMHTDYEIVHRILKNDKTERYVREEGTVKLDHNGQPVHMMGIVHDITEEHEREMNLLLQAEIFNAAQDSIMVHDSDGHFLYLNENAWKTRGYSEEEMMKMTVNELDTLEDHDNSKQLKEVYKKIKEEGYTSFQLEHVCKNGDTFPVEIYKKFITLQDKSYFLSSVRDMTKQKKAQKEVKKLSKVVEQIDDSVIITDNMGAITYVNKAFSVHTGYSTIGKTPWILKSNHYEATFYQNLWSTISSGEVFNEVMVNKKKNGDIFYEKRTITPLKDKDDTIVGFVSSGKDVTSETIMSQQLEHLASTDKLTDIYNRHKFEELFMLETERSRRFSLPLSLIMIDIDLFKNVNDTYGHVVGDDVLKHLAVVVQENIRKLDIFARWGGEEFLVLAPNTDLDKVRILAEKLRLAIETYDFPTVKNITISAGISVFKENDSFDTLFKRTDQALYNAKNNGRNQVASVS